jgi:prophage maintenance system killer protein
MLERRVHVLADKGINDHVPAGTWDGLVNGIIDGIRTGQATDLFGRIRDDGLASILGNLEQTFGGVPLYPNVDTRAANLLYMVIKNHPFFDGNKRIGSLLFLHYLSKNQRPLLEQNTLVALALLIAESDPKHKDVVVRLTTSLMQTATVSSPPV